MQPTVDGTGKAHRTAAPARYRSLWLIPFTFLSLAVLFQAIGIKQNTTKVADLRGDVATLTQQLRDHGIEPAINVAPAPVIVVPAAGDGSGGSGTGGAHGGSTSGSTASTSSSQPSPTVSPEPTSTTTSTTQPQPQAPPPLVPTITTPSLPIN